MRTVFHYLCIAVIAVSVMTTAFVAGNLYGPGLSETPVAEPSSITVSVTVVRPEIGLCPTKLQALYDHAVKVKVDEGWGTGLYCRGLDPYGDMSKVWVVTAAHVVDEQIGRVVQLIHEAGGAVTECSGTVRYSSKDCSGHGPDFALIEPAATIFHSTIPTVSWLDEKPILGETVWFAGNLDSTNLSVEKGTVACLDFKSRYSEQHFTMVNGIGVPGASGSCMFVVRDGQLKLIGLLVAGKNGIETQSWVTQATAIKAYLASIVRDTPQWLAH